MKDTAAFTPDATLGAGFRRELDAALGSLPERYRQPLVLFHLEGAPLEEVSRRLDLKPSTLRTRLSRARDLLRQVLERRGVAITSVGAMATLFAAEAKAATCSTSVLSSLLATASGQEASFSPRVLELAGNLTGGPAATLSSTLTTLTILMKTKAALVSAVVLALLAIGTTAYVATADPDGTGTESSPGSRAVTRDGERTKSAERTAPDPLSRINSEEGLYVLMESVMLISDDAERLAAIREKLGMEISDEVYRKALEAYGYQVNPGELGRLLGEMWLEEDPNAAMSWVARLGEATGERSRSSEVVASWAKRDEAAALAWAEENLSPEEIDKVRSKLERSRSSRPEPETSTETANRLRGMQEKLRALTGEESGRARSNLQVELGSIFHSWAHRDPQAAQAAIEFWATLDEDTRKGMHHIVGSAFGAWAKFDPDAALTRAKVLTNAEERAAALRKVLPAWQLKYPDRTIDEAADLSRLSDELYENIVFDVVENWATANPSAAMDFAMTKVEDAATRNKLVLEVVESWTRRDPHGAGGWVTAQPAGELRDEGLREVSERLSMSDFDAAAQLVKQIGDPELKRKTIGSIIMNDDTLKDHLPQALELTREVGPLDPGKIVFWARKIDPKDLDVYRSWVEQADSEGRINYATEPNSDRADLKGVLEEVEEEVLSR